MVKLNANITNKPISILHVAETLKGGIASYFEEILGHQMLIFGESNVHILIPKSHCQELSCDLNQKHYFLDHRLRLFNVLILICHIRRILSQHSIDIIHAHSSFAGLAARIALRGCANPPKLVYCAHGWAFDRDSSKLIKKLIIGLERFLSRYTDIIVCISEHDYFTALSAGIEAKRLVKICNAISPYFNVISKVDWPEGFFRFLFVGRFDRQKGADIFIEAMKIVGKNAHAYMVGSYVVDGKQLTSLPDNIQITGWIPRDAVQSYISSAQILVMPSRWEGFGLMALEAMRASRPVIASHVGGLAEIVIDKKTGFLIKPNSFTELANTMLDCMSGKIDLNAMGRSARDRFDENYTSERLNEELITLYYKLLN